MSSFFIRILKLRIVPVFAVALVSVLVLGGAVSVWAAKGDLRAVRSDVATLAPLYITLGKAELIDVEGDVADVLVADSSIVDVRAVQSNRLYLVGLEVGDTNLIALDERGNIVKRIDVHVRYDLQAVQALVESLFPDEAVQVGSIHDQIYLTGTVSTPEIASKVVNIVGHYVSDLQDEDEPADSLVSNLLEVRGEQQVMLQVKIVEATRNILRELGVDTNFNDPNELAATTIFGRTPPSSVTNSSGNSAAFDTGAGVALSAAATGVGTLLYDTGIDSLGTMGLFLSALEDESLVNILAEPNLTAISGQQAGFLAGGEFPVPVGRDQVGNVIIEFREFGVSLNFKPVVLSENRISLQMNTEVSSLDFDSALILANVTVPGLSVRRMETTVEIPSGGSLMVAGLLQSETVQGFAGLPGISKTPVLGKLVSSDSFQRDETELLIIVTPYLVESYEEVDRADHVPVQDDNPLARVFAANVRRLFDIEDDTMFALDEHYGYLLD